MSFKVAIATLSLIGLAATSATAQAVSDTDIESFLGLTSGTIDGLGNGDATEGSAIKQTFSGTTGQTLTFDWNFLTNESTPSSFNDFAFISLFPDGNSTLADTNSRFPLLGNNVSFNSETGFNAFSFILPADGDYTLGLGVVDVGDTVVDSALLVDNLNLGTNGSFETGEFSGWETVGNATIADSSFGIDPTDGNSQALLATAAVPEPTTILGSALLLGAGAFLKRRARRSQKAATQEA
ncbi:PEP-CTERM sorting domain-containing protein [Acaryochloris thomasi]|nr:PEP-CTERM sorting domain-containing protein [Acaryochloris thomasi]